MPSFSSNYLNFRVQGTPIIIQFHSIHGRLPGAVTRACLQAAANVCTLAQIAGEGATALGVHAYTYGAGTVPNDVNLVLVPQPQLIWRTWTRVVDAVFFVQSYLEYKELLFTILWEVSPGQVRVDGVGRMWGGFGTDDMGEPDTAGG
ncbi:MAG: hypothetical protein ASARMPREDX12_005068 [Alectoria sarmentosa]|nr:MAG: hypothetical protein ASARMPRED_005268 [Alectoria sarmentosa]CAD6591304.1 MAG: hypothetical protein ASARMPREDX12_005068 [Alectoria sarmentosa]